MNIKTIAEIGSVHDGSFGNCLKLIELAKNCGADVVKFQYHIAEYETLTHAEGPSYFNDEKRFDYFERTSFTLNQWKKIINHCKKKKIKFLCSVFSIESFKNLLSLGVKSFKLPSGEVTNLPLLDEMSKKKNIKIFLSTGMSNYKEIDKAYKILKNNKLVIMQCTSLYPCPNDKVGINVIKKLKNKYKFCEIGFSDHTIGNVSAILAIANGATYFEKHLTFSRKMYGSDAQFASEPDELSNYCESLKKAEIILSKDVNKDDLRPLVQMRKIFQKSILYSDNLKKGKKITLKNVVFLKPDKGISAQNYKSILGKKIKRDVKKNEFVKYSDFS
tara:strand:- start:22539 stop:23531 length:993 start_codon:yes stop_codon:yes gene_type:complete